MTKVIDVLFLLGLPASGKAEVRRYLEELPAHQRRDELHLGPLVNVHDYSYVHMMRRISEVLRSLGRGSVFFDSDEAPMKETCNWGMLVELLNEDFEDYMNHRQVEPASAAAWLLDRYDVGRVKCGGRPAFGRLPTEVREKLVFSLEAEAQEMVALRNAAVTIPLEGRTIAISIARGGPEKSTFPLPGPLGYQHALARFSDGILSRASILHVSVPPEVARRNNAERAPAGPGGQSVLHHGVPLRVMIRDYGCDDMDHLIRTSGRADTVRIETRGRSYMIPIGCFDNRVDKTSFVRGDKTKWPTTSVLALHQGLAEAMTRILVAGAPMKEWRAAA